MFLNDLCSVSRKAIKNIRIAMAHGWMPSKNPVTATNSAIVRGSAVLMPALMLLLKLFSSLKMFVVSMVFYLFVAAFFLSRLKDF